MKICLFNPALIDNNKLPSENLGDFIVEEAIKRELFSLFSDLDLIELSSHTFPSYQKYLLRASQSDFIFAGGTNLLGSHMRLYKQWKLSLKQKILLGKAILFGVGWENYQSLPDLYTKLSIHCLLSTKFIHSVRDNYTLRQLKSIGIKNVVNTGCPTMWPFLDFNFSNIPKKKSNNILIMLTDYKKDYQLDKRLIQIALDNYEKVIFWPQGKGDSDYIINILFAINNMNFNLELLTNYRLKENKNPLTNIDSRVILLEHSIDGFKYFLESTVKFDYIGTRLHGGIKCLLSCRRGLILEIDNRASEIAKDTGLTTVKRGEFNKIENWIHGENLTKINLDSYAINQWRSQFNTSDKINLINDFK